MLTASAMTFAILPMIIYTVFVSTMLSSNGDQEFRNTILTVADNERNTIQAYIDSVNKQVDTIMNYGAVKEALSSGTNTDAAGNFLSSFASSNNQIESIALVDSDGNVFCGSSGKAKTRIDNFAAYSDYSDGALYFNDITEPNATGGGTNPTMFIKQTSGRNTLLVNFRLSTVGDSRGFMYKASGGSTFYNGSVVIADSSPRHNYSIVDNFKKDLSKEYPQSLIDEINKLPDNSVSGIISYYPTKLNSNENQNEEWYASVAKVGGENGLIIIASCAVDKNANSFSTPATNNIVLATVLLSILAIVGAVIAAFFVTKPLKVIEETLEKVRRGDHEARIPTAVSNNEYGQMSRAFNNLLDEIVVSEDRYRTITEMSDNIIFEWNFKTNEVFFTNNFNKKFSYRAPSDHFGDSFLLKAKLHEEDSERYKEDLEKLGRGEEFKHNEYRMKNIYGDYIWVLIRTATLHDKEGNPLKIVGVILDIDRAKKSEQQLTARASFDALTELYNRETIESQIDNEINLSEARKSEMAVLFIDVDDFKHYNDQYSHATGDQVLKFVARTIKGVVNEFGFAGRYGGDEFIVCVRNAEINDPTRVAQDIITKLDEGFDCDGEHLTVSVSIGIAVIRDDYNTRVEYLIGKADDAMYSVKKNGKSNYAFI